MVKYENFQNEDDCAVIIDNEQPPGTRDTPPSGPTLSIPTVTDPTDHDLGPQVVLNKRKNGFSLTLNHIEWCLFGCFAHGFAYNRLSKRFGISHGIYKFILPYCFAFIVTGVYLTNRVIIYNIINTIEYSTRIFVCPHLAKLPRRNRLN